MLQKLEITTLHKAVKDKVEAHTGLNCYDEVPLNKESPFYFIEVTGKRAENTKTMWIEVFTVTIHAIAEPSTGSKRIYDLIKLLEESLTEEIRLPDPFVLILQTEQGLQTIKVDETNEKHAVLAWEFKVAYGYKTKI